MMARFILNMAIVFAIWFLGPVVFGVASIALRNALGMTVDTHEIAIRAIGYSGGLIMGFFLWGWR